MGDAAPWISRAATCLAGSAPSVTVLVNGGDIAYKDATFSLEAVVRSSWWQARAGSRTN